MVRLRNATPAGKSAACELSEEDARRSPIQQAGVVAVFRHHRIGVGEYFAFRAVATVDVMARCVRSI